MNKSDRCLLTMALMPNKINTVFAHILLDLPKSNGQILFAIYRNNHQQLTAVLKPHNIQWDPSNIRQENEVMVLPDGIFRVLKRRLKEFGIIHILGVKSEDKLPKGILLRSDTVGKINPTVIH